MSNLEFRPVPLRRSVGAPHRLVLGWQINGNWKYDPTFVTEVEIVFTAPEVGPWLTTDG